MKRVTDSTRLLVAMLMVIVLLGAGGCQGSGLSDFLGLKPADPAGGPGGASTQPVLPVERVQSEVERVAAANAERIRELDAFLVELPAEDPRRATYAEELKWRKAAHKYAPPPGSKLDINNPALDLAAGAIPGGIGVSALVIARLIYSLRKTKKQFVQAVKSVDVAFPQKSAEQKLLLSAVQDADTRAAVEAAKTS